MSKALLQNLRCPGIAIHVCRHRVYFRRSLRSEPINTKYDTTAAASGIFDPLSRASEHSRFSDVEIDVPHLM